ncbi:8072_t:CDS:10 [Cetraspora pellucida]|uniref:8072_t:CDS:1 n=1 Tax=Cetraspora pellucida TaxID=1433469 RepID=A0A9N9EWD7_9GLOM|nr:8072_t:CDS:10 [Cetraspora pellucida]
MNEPPLVPYSFPIIGHTKEYFTNTESFLTTCRKQYGEIFSLYVFGEIITIIGKEHSFEITKNHNDFNFFEAFRETLPTDSLLRRPITFNINLIKLVNDRFSSTGRYITYMNKIQDALKISIDKYIGECIGQKYIKSLDNVASQLVARNIVSIVLGEKFSYDDEIVNTFANLTTEITGLVHFPPILNFIHKSLHRSLLIFRLKYASNVYPKHRNLLFNKLSLIIKQREHEKKELGDTSADILQMFIDFSTKDDIVDLQELTDYIVEFIFISVQATSNALRYTLYEYGSHPEYWKELLEENEMISNIVKDGYFDLKDIDKMVKLDSFIKETLRYWMPCGKDHNIAKLGLQHKTISDYFTFSNGYQVPKGRNVYLYVSNIHETDQIGSTFNGFRYVGKNSPATRLGDDFVPFGRGRHAC